MIDLSKDDILEAEDARKIAFKRLNKNIMEASKKGQSWIRYDNEMGTGFKKFLEDKGYVIDVMLYPQKYIKISW